MTRPAYLGLLVFLLIVWAFGCSSARGGLFKERVSLSVKHQKPLSSEDARTLLAGAAKVDITPSPGMPLAGYSTLAKRAIGFRTRLYARALYLKPKEGPPIALVALDLLSGSELLQHRVAEIVAKKTDVGIEGLCLAGTHTHSGPGNYFGSVFYNRFGSNLAGFNPKFFDFLAQRVANAVVLAYESRRPARIATGKLAVWGFTRNRSMEAYLANQNLPKLASQDVHRAVNPWLWMVRVDGLSQGGAYEPLAALSSFSIHGTAVPPKNALYSADVFAYIERELEGQIESETGRPFVHLVVNGTHADNSPDYAPKMQGFLEARRIGVGVGKKALSMFRRLEKGLRQDVPVRSLAVELDLFKERCVEDVCLCPRPVVGATLMAGAEDGQPPVIHALWPFKEGSRRLLFKHSCQGRKLHALGPLQPLLLPKSDFPHLAFLQVLQVGDLSMLAVPFEVSLEMGRRIVRAASKGAPQAVEPIVISCANGYFGYLTTPEEYSMQHYEGGHTLYGKMSGPFVALKMAGLLERLGDEAAQSDIPESWSYQNYLSRFLPPERDYTGERRAAGAPIYKPSKKNQEAFFAFRWYDVPPSVIRFHEPLVLIEAEGRDGAWSILRIKGIPQNDKGYDISVAYLGKSDNEGMGLYEAKWYNPLSLAGSRYRFVILPREGQPVFFSQAFSQVEGSRSEHVFSDLYRSE